MPIEKIHRSSPARTLTASLMLSGLLLGCAANVPARDLPPVPPVADVDLPRFMGRWYVIATIPTRFEVGAHDAVESYRLEPDGTIDTQFYYRKGGFDEPVKSIRSTGFVREGTRNAVWGVRFFWPFKAQYIIAYLNADYSQTIVARDARDYVWIMARTPTIPQADYQTMVEKVEALGYDVSKLWRVPHSPAR